MKTYIFIAASLLTGCQYLEGARNDVGSFLVKGDCKQNGKLEVQFSVTENENTKQVKE